MIGALSPLVSWIVIGAILLAAVAIGLWDEPAMINAWVEPLRTYRHPRGTCLFAGVLKQGRYALGAGPVCRHCGVRYWVVDDQKEGRKD